MDALIHVLKLMCAHVNFSCCFQKVVYSQAWVIFLCRFVSIVYYDMCSWNMVQKIMAVDKNLAKLVYMKIIYSQRIFVHILMFKHIYAAHLNCFRVFLF